jgi:putative redox protein
MSTAVQPTIAELVWKDELVFTGTSGETSLVLDSASKAGPSPMQALALGLAGCMSMDVVHILKKGRHDLRGLRAKLVGRRAQDSPKRFLAIELHFIVAGNVPIDQVERAVDLSRETYCSVWQSMRQDIDFRVSVEVQR